MPKLIEPDSKIAQNIAKNLSELADAVKNLMNGPLKKKTLIVLLANAAGMSQLQVTNVLQALENLEKDWLNK